MSGTRTLTAISAKSTWKATANLTNDTGGVTAQNVHGSEENPSLSTGLGDNQADRVWEKKAWTIPVGTVDLDLYDFGSLDIGGGAGRDALGQVMALAEIVGIRIKVVSGAGTLLVGGNGTAAAWNSLFNASDSAKIGPFKAGARIEHLCPADGNLAVADTTNHLLRLEAVTTDMVVDVMVLGRSA